MTLMELNPRPRWPAPPRRKALRYPGRSARQKSTGGHLAGVLHPGSSGFRTRRISPNAEDSQAARCQSLLLPAVGGSTRESKTAVLRRRRHKRYVRQWRVSRYRWVTATTEKLVNAIRHGFLGDATA